MLIEGLKREWQEREHKLLKELDAAKATITNKDERDRCYLAYFQLFDGLRDEMQQRMGLQNCLAKEQPARRGSDARYHECSRYMGHYAFCYFVRHDNIKCSRASIYDIG